MTRLYGRWKGGRIKDANGYIYILCPNHPYAIKKDKKGSYVAEHRLVMEKSIGRYLKRSEVVHHKNGKTGDNRIENLELTTNSKHCGNHNSVRVWKKESIIKQSIKANTIMIRDNQGRFLRKRC